MNVYESILTTPSTAQLKYITNNKHFSFTVPLVTEASAGALSLQRITHTIKEQDHFELEYVATAQEELLLQSLEFEVKVNLEDHVMLGEGFQCWSTTKEVGKHNRLAAIPKAVSWITKFNLQGDYDFFNYSGKQGHLHATGYTYLRHTPSGNIVFIGSVSEHSGYSYYKANFNDHTLSFYKDIEGKSLKKGQELRLKFSVFQGKETSDLTEIWSRYATYYDPQHAFRNPDHLTGWSSWYNFYERVTEADVLASLKAFEQHPYPIDVFQIDDGYQVQIGDWLDVDKNKFPRGMKALADDIIQQGKMPGIWIAPYAVGFNSTIVEEHPDWLLKYPNSNQLLVAGPNWGGFYALDIYNPEAKAYLERVFDEVLDTWGFKLLKLDFLFAAAMVPRLGKSRGEIMWDATDLIVKLTRKRALILGSGVPLPSTWGKFEYNRMSSDASPWWDHTVLKLANVRERVSTLNALTSTLNRWPIGSRMLGGDPDVFFIRSDNNKLSVEEKHTLLIVNIILGQLTLMSDNVNLYNESEHRLYGSIFPKPEAQVKDMQSIGIEAYKVEYTCNRRKYLFLTNLSPLPVTTQLPLDDDGKYIYYFEHSNVLVQSKVDWLKSQSTIFLKPHETRAFMKVSDDKQDVYIGSTGHIVPGTEIDALLSNKKDVIHITLKKRYTKIKENKIYIRLDSSESVIPTVYVDNKLISNVKKYIWNEDITFIKVTLHTV
ncbi:hypothetical protein G6F43_002988 [Rhizopus delemar]|nr:hypothetical protein G6F43_002988 [Rhizopus delemar]